MQTSPSGPAFRCPSPRASALKPGIPTAAVGMITEPAQANEIVSTGQADMVFLAREMLRDPYWPLHAAAALSEPADWPVQYLRAAPHKSLARARSHGPRRPENNCGTRISTPALFALKQGLKAHFCFTKGANTGLYCV